MFTKLYLTGPCHRLVQTPQSLQICRYSKGVDILQLGGCLDAPQVPATGSTISDSELFKQTFEMFISGNNQE